MVIKILVLVNVFIMQLILQCNWWR